MPYDIDPHRLPDLARISDEDLGDLLVASHDVDRRSARSAGWKSGLLGPRDEGDGAEAEKAPAAGERRVRFHHTWSDWSGGDELASTGRVGFDHRTDGMWHEAPLAELPRWCSARRCTTWTSSWASPRSPRTPTGGRAARNAPTGSGRPSESSAQPPRPAATHWNGSCPA